MGGFYSARLDLASSLLGHRFFGEMELDLA